MITKLIGDIFRNAALSESFFYRNDFNVLLEIILRELGNREVSTNDISRQLLLNLLGLMISLYFSSFIYFANINNDYINNHYMSLDPVLRKSDYREHCHIIDQVTKQLNELIDYRDPVVAKMATNLLVHLKEIRMWKK